MRRRSNVWKSIVDRGNFTFDAKARINNKDYLKISAPRINRSLLSSPLSVGNCMSATLKLSILTDDNIKAKDPIVILGRIFNDIAVSDWMEFGTFYIDNVDLNFNGVVTVECFDAMLKTNQNYLGETDTSSEWPKSMKTVVEEIAYRIGVGIDERTLIRSGPDYTVPYPSGKTMNQVLGYIGACHGGNWIITEENLLRLVPLTFTPSSTDDNPSEPPAAGEQPVSLIPRTYNITDEYGNRITTPEGHSLVWDIENSDTRDAPSKGPVYVPIICGKLTKYYREDLSVVSGVTMSNENGERYTAGYDNGIVLEIANNPYASQRICYDLFASLRGLMYFPYNATKAVYDPAAELGDQVIVPTMLHSVMYDERITLDHNFRADIAAPNSSEFSSLYPYLSETEGAKRSTRELRSIASQASATSEQNKSGVAALQAEMDGIKETLQAETDGIKETLQAETDGIKEAIAAIIARLDGICSNN